MADMEIVEAVTLQAEDVAGHTKEAQDTGSFQQSPAIRLLVLSPSQPNYCRKFQEVLCCISP